MSPPRDTHLQAPTPGLIHAVNNFLNVVVTTGQVALDRDMDYPAERALESILAGAEELRTFLRSQRGLQPARSQDPPVAAGPLE